MSARMLLLVGWLILGVLHPTLKGQDSRSVKKASPQRVTPTRANVAYGPPRAERFGFLSS